VPPPHHAPGGGFRNPWPLDVEPVPFGRALRWGLGFAARARRARRPTPVERRTAADFAAPVAPGAVRATWLGHTAVLLQYPGATVLTDPMFGARASPLAFMGPKRETPLPTDPDALPRVDVVLLSHDHYDHLDRGSVAWLHRRDRPLFVAPLGVGARLRRWLPDVRAVELDWGASAEPEGAGLRVHAAPACHFSSRTPFDRDRTLWASFYLEPLAGSPSVYFAGDSGYAPHFAAVRARHGAPDLALVPIGAYDPRWIMKPVHLNPEEAVQAALDLGARTVLGTHWGTFILTDEPMDEPPRRFLAEAARRGLGGARVLPVGGMLDIPARGLG
jgi:N-acyl-phosphatidylethanolamine-hydrolysing phospholipase D